MTNQKMWCMYRTKDGIKEYDYTTLSCMRKWCWEYFLKQIVLTKSEVKKYGWRCEKVSVTIKSLNDE